MNWMLLLAAGLLAAPVPGGGMVRNQVVKRAVSMWAFIKASDVLAGPDRSDVQAEPNEMNIPEVEIERAKNVEPPGPQLKERARVNPDPIVLLVMRGGEIRAENGRRLVDDEGVLAYLRDQKEGRDGDAPPRLHLKAGKKVAFAHMRRVIRLAAKEGLHEVIFLNLDGQVAEDGAEQADQVLPDADQRLLEKLLAVRRRDAKLQLPEAEPDEDQPGVPPLFIKIDDEERVHVGAGAAEELLDDAADDRLPLLNQRLKAYLAAVRLTGSAPAVQLYVDPAVQRARVMDVLDVLRQHEIEKVTFTDLIDAE